VAREEIPVHEPAEARDGEPRTPGRVAPAGQRGHRSHGEPTGEPVAVAAPEPPGGPPQS